MCLAIFPICLILQSQFIMLSLPQFNTLPSVTLNRQVKVNGIFLYSAVSSPLDRSERFTLHPPTWQTCSIILARQQLSAKTKSLIFPPLSIARYSFKQLSQLGRQWRERKCPIFETVAKGDSNPGSLDCESGVLALSYRAPQSYILLVRLTVNHSYVCVNCCFVEKSRLCINCENVHIDAS